MADVAPSESRLEATVGIQPPARASALGTTLILLAVALQAANVFLPRASAWWVAVALAGLALTGLATRQVAAVHLALFAASTVVVLPLPFLRPWPLPLVVALVLYGNAALLSPTLRAMPTWLRLGTLDRTTWALVGATIAVSAVALVIWNAAARPDLARFLGQVPVVPPWALPLVGIGFAVFNAAAEEAAFRGVLMQSLDAALGPGVASLGVQAAAFGVLHRQGFPGGPSGMVLAAIYGVTLGIVRRRSRGMLAPWIAHVAADGVIFGIIVLLAR